MSEIHAQARTTPRTRAEIKNSTASLLELAKRYNISVATARKCAELPSGRRLCAAKGSLKHHKLLAS